MREDDIVCKFIFSHINVKVILKFTLNAFHVLEADVAGRHKEFPDLCHGIRTERTDILYADTVFSGPRDLTDPGSPKRNLVP